MIAWIVAAVLGGPLVLVCHEASHALVARVRGARITTFRPWPHWQRVEGGGRIWRWGYVGWIYGEAFRPARVLWSSPLWADLIVGGASVAVALLAFPPAAAVAAWNVVDALWWVRGVFGLGSKYPEQLDGWKWRHFPRSAPVSVPEKGSK